jgi:CRP-like cAMP-binding protein
MDERRLRDIPLFAGLGKHERQALSKHADEVDAAEGKVLAREGDFAYEFFVIEQGTAEVTIDGEARAELGPGDFFGEIGALGKVPRVATVTAKTPMELIVMTSRDIRALDRGDPEVAQQLRDAIAQRLPETNAAPLTN